jgi:tRNA (guanine26-N2/guanine27-N2)-dimethyltransferase
MYGGPLHNPAFIERIRDYIPNLDAATYPTKDRIDGMLYTAYQEMSFGTKNPTFAYVEKPEEFSVPKMDPAIVDEHPFFFIPSAISRVIHCSAPPTAALRGALLHAGFKVTMSHCKPGSIKTNANWEQIWHIMREWVRQKAPQKNPLKEGSPGRAIMQKGQASQAKPQADSALVAVGSVITEVTDVEQDREREAISEPKQEDKPGQVSASDSDGIFEVIFDEKLGKDHERGKYVRYQLAPRENWGPMARAK